MIKHQMHRPVIESHPLGQIYWYKEFEKHEAIHRDGTWTPSIYVILIVIKGEGELLRGKERHPIAAGDLVIVFPRLAHGIIATAGQPLSMNLLGFAGPVFDLWQTSGLLDRNVPIIELRDGTYWAKRLMEVPMGEDETVPERDLQEICRLQNLMSQARAHVSNSASAQDEERWCHQTLQLMRENLMHHFDLEWIAEQQGVTYDVFRRKFRQHFKMPPRKYFNRLILESACAMLLETTAPHGDIAERLGFCDEYYFSRFMKNYLGISPREYRRMQASTRP